MSTTTCLEEVCGQKTFTEVENRPVVRERVERIVEHRPVEKQVGIPHASSDHLHPISVPAPRLPSLLRPGLVALLHRQCEQSPVPQMLADPGTLLLLLLPAVRG
jgi:hypothetical protein